MSKWARESAYGGKSTSELDKENGMSGVNRVKKEAAARRTEKKNKKPKHGDYVASRKVIKNAYNNLKKQETKMSVAMPYKSKWSKGGKKQVNPKGQMVQTAKAIGISFGD